MCRLLDFLSAEPGFGLCRCLSDLMALNDAIVIKENNKVVRDFRRPAIQRYAGLA